MRGEHKMDSIIVDKYLSVMLQDSVSLQSIFRSFDLYKSYRRYFYDLKVNCVLSDEYIFKFFLVRSSKFDPNYEKKKIFSRLKLLFQIIIDKDVIDIDIDIGNPIDIDPN